MGNRLNHERTNRNYRAAESNWSPKSRGGRSDVVDVEEAKVLTLTMARHLTDMTDRDSDVALSLIEARGKWGSLTIGQAKLARNLIERVRNPREVLSTGSMTRVIKMFDKASEKLKYPAIVIQCDDVELKLNLAGPRSKNPGCVNVSTNEPFGSNTWFGCITPEGEFRTSRSLRPEGLVPLLNELAADPETVAARHGKITGKCCFCNRALGEGEDQRSVEVGYGPVCAKHYGLQWG